MTQAKKPNRVSFVDLNECTGCEACVVVAPKVFRMTAEGLSEVFAPQGDTEEKILEAMDSCPVSCIHWKS